MGVCGGRARGNGDAVPYRFIEAIDFVRQLLKLPARAVNIERLVFIRTKDLGEELGAQATCVGP